MGNFVRWRSTWMERLRRVFAIDLSTCPDCGRRLRVIADVTVRRLLGKSWNTLHDNGRRRNSALSAVWQRSKETAQLPGQADSPRRSATSGSATERVRVRPRVHILPNIEHFPNLTRSARWPQVCSRPD